MASSNGNGTLVSMRVAQGLTGYSANTLRSWANSGRLKAYRVGPLGKRRFARSDLEELLGIKKQKENVLISGKVLAYIRISDGKRAAGFAKGQESDMSRQKDRVVSWAKEEYGVEPILFSDIGSGLSYETRKSFTRLMKQILVGQHDGSILLVENKDRLARFGTEVLTWICEAHSIKLIYTDKHDETEAKELADDLLSIIHVFSSRSYAMRSAKRLLKHPAPETIDRIRELRNSGMAISRIADQLRKENYTTLDNVGVSVAVIRRYLDEKPQLQIEKVKTSVDIYVEENITRGPSNLRILSRDLYAHYVGWTKTKGINGVSRLKFAMLLKEHGVQDTIVKPTRDSSTIKAWVGIVIKQNEKLSYKMNPRPRKPKPKTPENNSFVAFYYEKLAGQWCGLRKQLDRDYLAWCVENGRKKISLKEIPRILFQISPQNFPTSRGRGFIYDLTKAPKLPSGNSVIENLSSSE